VRFSSFKNTNFKIKKYFSAINQFCKFFSKTPSETAVLWDYKNTSIKNIAKNMHFMQKKCKSVKLIYIFDLPIKTKKT
jgi:hypothetical protein